MTIKQALKDAELLVLKLKEADSILGRLAPTNGKPVVEGLTPTEEKVLDLIREGRDRQEIAQLLKISAKTADVHRDHIRQKMGFTKTKDFYRAVRT